MLTKHISNLFKSPASLYVILRYVTYGLQFANSILLVNVLGEFSYGVYGFIIMFTLYFIYLNMGVNDSLNAEYALHKDNPVARKELWNNALSIVICWYGFILILSIVGLRIFPDVLSKYEFSSYGYALLLTCIIHNISILYATLYKIYGKTLKVNVEQLLPQIGILILIIGGKDVASISAVVMVMLGANLFSLVLYLISPPEKFTFSFQPKVIVILIKRGISLLLYNLSFQLLTMLALMAVSAWYTVEQMGCYSLANSITNGVLMAGGAFLFIFFPKIINRMGNSKEDGKRLIDKFETIYIIFIDFVSIISIICVWILSLAYPSYGTTFVKIYIFLIIGRIINNCAIGFSTYLISIKKERLLVICGISALVISAIGYAFIKLYALPIIYVPQMIVGACVVFSVMTIAFSQRYLYGRVDIKQMFRFLLGQSKWVIIITGGVYAFIYDSYIILLAGFFLYLALNYKRLFFSIKHGYRIVANRSSLKF